MATQRCLKQNIAFLKNIETIADLQTEIWKLILKISYDINKTKKKNYKLESMESNKS